ncbi:5417_t:CDS:10 [Gigaspora rosea]|nr:5417_t:CDS:10 [Gigaspora rosea]
MKTVWKEIDVRGNDIVFEQYHTQETEKWYKDKTPDEFKTIVSESKCKELLNEEWKKVEIDKETFMRTMIKEETKTRTTFTTPATLNKLKVLNDFDTQMINSIKISDKSVLEQYISEVLAFEEELVEKRLKTIEKAINDALENLGEIILTCQQRFSKSSAKNLSLEKIIMRSRKYAENDAQNLFSLTMDVDLDVHTSEHEPNTTSIHLMNGFGGVSNINTREASIVICNEPGNFNYTYYEGNDYERKGKTFKSSELYTYRLSKILDEYPDGSQILREILQNFDDSKSRLQPFLLDYNAYPTNNL